MYLKSFDKVYLSVEYKKVSIESQLKCGVGEER